METQRGRKPSLCCCATSHFDIFLNAKKNCKGVHSGALDSLNVSKFTYSMFYISLRNNWTHAVGDLFIVFFSHHLHFMGFNNNSFASNDHCTSYVGFMGMLSVKLDQLVINEEDHFGVVVGLHHLERGSLLALVVLGWH